ncbi:MAG: transferase [Thermoleophilia bacterium]|nr:transferase [Thermoleophilia bacterium]
MPDELRHPRAPLTDVWTDRERAAASRLATALRRAGFTREAVGHVLAWEPSALPAVVDPVVAAHRARADGTDLGLVICAFVLGDVVERAALTAALSVEALDDLGTLGLIEPLFDSVTQVQVQVQAQVQVLAQVVPWDERVLLFGDPEFGLDADRPDDAFTITPSSRMVHTATMRVATTRALDLGTGTGLHAIAAAQTARTVVATDLNPRALAFARINMAANDVANVELRHGDLFTPVDGERYDLIVGNLPFIIAPPDAGTSLYRFSGLRADDMSRRVVIGSATHLAEGGYATLSANWACPSGEPVAPLTEWLDDRCCDAIVFISDISTPLEHAQFWNRGLAATRVGWQSELDRWLEYLAAEGIEQVAQGCVVLRQRAPEHVPNWIHPIHIRASLRPNLSAQAATIFAACDGLGDVEQLADLLDGRVELATDCVIERRHRTTSDGAEFVAATAACAAQPALAVDLDPFELHLVDGIADRRPLHEVLDHAQAMLGVDAAVVEPIAGQLLVRLAHHALASVARVRATTSTT